MNYQKNVSKQSSIRDWIGAARPRTLLLATASVILGTGLALHDGHVSVLTFILSWFLAISIQILANFANDLGDYEKGTDITGNRQGPTRAMQSGKMSRKTMLHGIYFMVLVSVIIGVLDVIFSLENAKGQLILLGIGLLCILAALFYTMGKHAYGYKGLGDFFAFLFFGPVAVLGTYYLHIGTLLFQPILPAIGLGLISTMILNVNNMRDIENDKKTNKITVAARMGLQKARIYHAILTIGSCCTFLGYSLLYASAPWYRYLYASVFLFFLSILYHLFNQKERKLDIFLGQTAIAGLLLVVIFSICINI